MKKSATGGAGFARRLVAWQRGHGRHDLPWQRTRDPYLIWVSEIMLQQTQVNAVVGYYARFIERFPDLHSLAEADEDSVLRYWSGLGYYARARNLHRAARLVKSEYGGEFPRTAVQIAALPGIGRSTAAAIAAFAFGERGAILDGNVKRVLARCFGIEGFPGSAKVEAQLWVLAEGLLPAQRDDIESYTQGLMDLGATICTRANPACEECPVATACIARSTGRAAELPSPRPRRDYPTRKARWLLLRHRGQVLLERRPPAGIWGRLWAFPEFEGQDIARYCLERFGCVVSGQRELPRFAHGFTHFRLEVSPVVCDVGRLRPRAVDSDRMWLSPEDAMAAAVPAPVRNLLRGL